MKRRNKYKARKERVREAICDLQEVQYNRNIMQGAPNSKAG